MTCCNLISKVLDKLIEKHAISKHDELQSTRIIGSLADDCEGKTMNSLKTYAKMTGLKFTEIFNEDRYNEEIKPQAGEDNILRWNNTKYDGKVKPIDGNIFIQDPGFYYVFSNIKINIPDTSSYIAHSHYVYVHSYSRGTLKPILANSKVLCETTSTTNEIVSTIGAVFQLEKHDKLFVRSSHPQHLISSEYSNVFGLYMI